MSNTIITQQGINFILSASTLGPFIQLKYFLPVYDYRADPNVHNGITTSAIDTSAAISQNDIIPYGEKIYNINSSQHAYSLSQNDHYVLSAAGGTLNSSSNPWVLTNSVMSKQQPVNQYDGVPLSNQYYGLNGVDALIATNTWNIYTGQIITGNNTQGLTGTDKYFKVVDYYPATSEQGLKGTFKCKISGNLGSVKFNKIALYAVQVDVNGTEIGTPTLFAEAMMKNPVIKTNFGTEGFDDIVIDVQLSISSIISTWDQVFYSTSGDYWQRTPNGLYYPERIGVGTYHEGSVGPGAMLDVRSDSIRQLRLAYDDVRFSDIFTDISGNLILSGTNSFVFTPNLKPISDNSYYLGTAAEAWKTVYVNTITNRNYILSASSIVPINNESYNLGSNSLRWNNVYIKQLDTTTINCGDIIPKSANSYSIGQIGNPFRSIVVNKIYADVNNSTPLNIISDVDPGMDNTYDFGKNFKWKNIRSTNAYFSNGIYEQGRTKKLGEWETISDDIIIYEDGKTPVNAATNVLVNQTAIGNTVFMMGVFTLTTTNSTQYIILKLPYKIGISTGSYVPTPIMKFRAYNTNNDDLTVHVDNINDGNSGIIYIYRRVGNFPNGSQQYWFSIWFESPYYNE